MTPKTWACDHRLLLPTTPADKVPEGPVDPAAIAFAFTPPISFPPANPNQPSGLAYSAQCGAITMRATVQPKGGGMTTSKQASSYRFTPECRSLFNHLPAYLGISQAGIIEMALRKLARAELPPDQQPDGEPPPAGQRRASKPK